MAKQVQPKLIIHGGAGSSLKGKGGLDAVRRSLRDIVQQTYAALIDGKPAEEGVAIGCRLLEDEPRFNAGTGSVLQSDGQVRMSAAIMVGDRQRFSGVINAGQVKNPIDLARLLQDSPDRVLSETGAALLAREQGIPIHNPLTDLRLREWIQERQGDFDASMANVVAEPMADASDEAGRGTIGVVVLDSQGRLAVGTSTGGKGFERIGRVSDSAMPAGNYATPTSAISCTGIGEDIIDECLAPRIAVRVTDGYTLEAAFARSCAEAQHNQRDLGAIGLDHTGAIAWGKTSDILLAAYHTGAEVSDTLEVPPGLQTGGCP